MNIRIYLISYSTSSNNLTAEREMRKDNTAPEYFTKLSVETDK